MECTGPDGTDGGGAFLLQDLVCWREALARCIARNNPEQKSDQIAGSVNQILFSLLLLRIAEDRHLLAESILDDLRYFRSCTECLEVLHGYAGALYAGESPVSPHPADIGTGIVIDENILRSILDALLSPDRRYDCGKMTTNDVADLLTHYLSRTIRRSATHQAVVVDSHDSVLSGGVVIPPRSLVGYMTSGALRLARENRSFREVLPLRIFDPACGTGTVLLAAFRQLRESTGTCLTPEERREILSQSIYGLDTNRHAVAAARMLLLLEHFDPDNEPVSTATFYGLFHEVLGDLRHTVLCGNALVGPEIVLEESWMFCPARERHTLNPFSFTDRFPEIMASGGFDAVVCNPPEGPIEPREWIQHHFQRQYAAYHPRVDRSAFFFEKALSLVCRGGTVAMILSSRSLRGSAGAPFRDVLKARQIEEIIDLSLVPAENPGAGLCIISARSSRPARPLQVVIGDADFIRDPAGAAAAWGFPVDPRQLDAGGWAFHDTRSDDILRKVSRHSTPLEDVVMGQVHPGIRITEGSPFVIDEALARVWIRRDPRCKSLLRPVIAGDGIGRYHAGNPKHSLILIPQGWTCSHHDALKNPWQWLKRRHPLIAKHLQPLANPGNARAGPEKFWWETNGDEFWQKRRKKIFIAAPFETPVFWPDTGRGVGDPTTVALASASLYLVGVLNSRLMAFVFDATVRQSSPDRKFFSWQDLARLPVFTPDLDRPEDLSRHDRIEYLVCRILDLQKHGHTASPGPEREVLRKKIRETDRQIDVLVYELYGLAAGEIAVVEAGREDAITPPE